MMSRVDSSIIVSVIVPVYNVEKYIEQCARSLFEQTMQEDIEFIFVDDCSPDKSIEILENILEEYPQRKRHTRIIHHSENQGLPAARQSGIAISKGKYIAHCDSDDWLDRDAYRLIVEKAFSEDPDMIIINDYVQSSNGNWYVRFSEGFLKHVNEETVLKFQIQNKLAGGVVQKIIKREFYDSTPLIKPASNVGEDLILSVQFCFYCKKIRCISKPLYFYRYNGYSLTHKLSKSSAIQRCQDDKMNIDLVIDFLKQICLYEKYKYWMTPFKLRCRNYLIPYLNEKEIYKLWHSTYSELDTWKYYSKLPWKDLFKYLLVRLRLYKFYTIIQTFYWRLKLLK